MSEIIATYETLRVERHDAVARIVLDRPPVNAINFQLADDYTKALDRLRRDESVRSVIVTGSGDQAFSAGVDLKELESADGRAMRRFLETFYFEMVELQYKMGKPTIAALNAPALAAGVTIAVSCDLIVAAEGTRIGYPEINVGLSPAMHLVMLPRMVGKFRAFELCFTGDPIPIEEAQRLGLVNRIVPKDRLAAESLAFAAELAAKPPLAMKLMRDTFYRNLDVEFRKGIGDAADVLCILKDSEDSHEGMRAFREKRPPRWSGR